MSDGEGTYDLALPFWIDTDGYTDRDRAMFAAGFEFAGLAARLESDDAPVRTTIHRENESRVRLLCGHLGRRCAIEACATADDPAGLWSHLEVRPR